MLKACLRGGCALHTMEVQMPPASASCCRNGSGNFFSRKLVVQRGFLLFQRRAMAGLSLFLLDEW